MSESFVLLPLELWRARRDGGGLFDLRLPPDPAYDLETYQVGDVTWVRHSQVPPRGISLWNGPMPAVRQGCWWVIPKETPIPHGLLLVPAKKRHKSGYWHYTLIPKENMPLAYYQALLRTLVPYAELKHACS